MGSPNATHYKIYGGADASGVTRYVGVTSKALAERLREHLSEARCSKNINHRLNWLRSLSKPPEIYLLEEGCGDWEERERYWISLFRAYGHKLVNGTDGGDGVANPSEETLAKRRGKRPNNTSGFAGVSWSKCCKKWVAEVHLKGRRIWQACFSDIEDAVLARALVLQLRLGDPQIKLPKPVRSWRCNTSGFVGVSWNRRLKKWHAHVKTRGMRVYDAYFSKKEDAIFARALAVELYAK